MSAARPESPAPLFDRTDNGRAFVPTAVRTAAARSGGPGRPSGRRGCALPWTAASPVARWPVFGTCVLLFTVLATQSATAQPRGAGAEGIELSAMIAEAGARFDVPTAWIRAVMGAESAFNPRAVSAAGAIGLMQVRPRTYADLRARYGLGPDPDRPRDNILAGAAYLREMYDRFGAPGFLAAYNAGPARYQQHLAEGQPLPPETRAYVAKLAPAIGLAVAPAPIVLLAARRRAAPRQTLFVALGAGRLAPAKTPEGGLAAADAAGSPLFAPLTARSEAR
jgi:hypothetical protein